MGGQEILATPIGNRYVLGTMIRLLPLLVVLGNSALAEDAAHVINLWPEKAMPGPAPLAKGEERDLTKDSDRLVGGSRIIKLGHVRAPQAHVFLPPPEKANGAAVVICPGGGFHILAWDLEGTEVAAWLNGMGVAAVVLKYRVPTGGHGNELVPAPGDAKLTVSRKALGPVMDAQRALSLTRAHAAEWRIDPARIGILGFSAGGQTAALATLARGRRSYGPVDDGDKASCTADFALLIYPGGLAENDGSLRKHLPVTESTPPIFFVHAADDRVSCLHSTALFSAMKKVGVHGELHIYAGGGHGYGLRPTELPVTRWPVRAAEWMKVSGFLTRSEK